MVRKYVHSSNLPAARYVYPEEDALQFDGGTGDVELIGPTLTHTIRLRGVWSNFMTFAYPLSISMILASRSAKRETIL